MRHTKISSRAGSYRRVKTNGRDGVQYCMLKSNMQSRLQNCDPWEYPPHSRQVSGGGPAGRVVAPSHKGDARATRSRVALSPESPKQPHDCEPPEHGQRRPHMSVEDSSTPIVAMSSDGEATSPESCHRPHDCEPHEQSAHIMGLVDEGDRRRATRYGATLA
jgi:hypothetical protein